MIMKLLETKLAFHSMPLFFLGEGRIVRFYHVKLKNGENMYLEFFSMISGLPILQLPQPV